MICLEGGNLQQGAVIPWLQAKDWSVLIPNPDTYAGATITGAVEPKKATKSTA